MSFEPEVIKSIKRYRRRGRLLRLSVILPAAAACLACLVVMIVQIARGVSLTDAFGPGHGVSLYLTAVFLIAPPLIMDVAIFFAARKDRQTGFIAKMKDADGDAGFNRYLGALDTVSLPAGIKPPRLVAFDLPTPNAFAFYDTRGRPCIGVTLAALERPTLGLAEVESVMAHQVAHVLDDDCRAAAGYTNRQFFPFHLFVLFTVLLVPALALALPAGWFRRQAGAGIGIAIGVFILAIAVFIITWLIMSASSRQDDILADSVAVRLTGDPGAMIDAIEKVDTLVNQPSLVLPFEQLIIDYMFVNPRPIGENEAAVIEQGVRAERDPSEKPEDRRQMLENAIRQFSVQQSDLLRERLENLEAIKQGSWRRFDI